MQVAITGGTGYVGSRLAEVLLKRGYNVVVVDIIPPQERNIEFSKGIEYRYADLRVPLEALASLKGADVVMHLAADIGSMSYMKEKKADIIKNNSSIDAALYPALVENQIPWVVYSSSSGVYQHAPSFPYIEKDVFDVKPPTNTYFLSKLAGEYFCRAYGEQYGLNHTIVRYHNIYGAGEDSKGATPGDIHVIPALLEKVIKGQYPLEFLGDDPKVVTRPFVYVDDAVEATARILDRVVEGDDVVKNEDFNIGNDRHHTLLELGEIIWKEYGDGRPFEYIVAPIHTDTALRREVDISKIKQKIGWEPKTSLEEGLKPTAEWIRTRKG